MIAGGHVQPDFLLDSRQVDIVPEVLRRKRSGRRLVEGYGLHLLAIEPDPDMQRLRSARTLP